MAIFCINVVKHIVCSGSYLTRLAKNKHSQLVLFINGFSNEFPGN